MDKICTKRYFRLKTEKVNIIIEFHLFKLVSWYQISVLTINYVYFWPDFSKNGLFWSKTPQVNTTYFLHNSAYSNLSSGKFSSNWQFWFFGPNLPKKVFPIKNRKSEHRHGILHIWIILGTKFQLKLTILSFWTKFTPKKVFSVENKTDFTWNPQPQKQSVQKVFFKFNPLFVVLTFSNNISITKVRVNERKN